MKCPARQPLTILLPLILLLGASAANCHAWSLASQPVEGVLLLKNSNVLRGKIQQLGDQFHVHMPNGKLQIRKQQVETVGPNIEAIYQYRRDQRGGSSADTHIELAAWCLRHELFDHAEAEIKEAESIDQEHRRLKLLQRQLKQLRQLADQQANPKPAEPTVADVVPVEPSEIETAPKWARALFVRQIQPLIVHSCATGGCHQASETESFQLNRLALEGAGHPGATLRNLAETLKHIDFATAEQSKLLEKARLAHGSTKGSKPLEPHKLQVLSSWVEQLAEAHQKENALRTVPALAEVEASPITPTLTLNPPTQNSTNPSATQPSIAQPSNTQPSEGIRVASFTKADPFDASAFNDRYGVKPQPAATQSFSAVPHLLVPGDPQPILLPQVE